MPLLAADDPEAVRTAAAAVAAGELLAFPTETVYGLAASAWTRDVYRAQRASREIDAGCVWINDHIPIISEMPHVGFKQSGYGKYMSLYAVEAYTEVKHVMIKH